MTDAVFSIYNTDDPEGFYARMVIRFKRTGLPDTDFYYHTFLLYMAPQLNLDIGHLNIGFAQIGKSTGALQEARAYYSCKSGVSLKEVNHRAPIDDWLINRKFVEINILWDFSQSLASVYDKMDRELVIGDEGMWRSDRRNSMKSQQIEKTEDAQVYAKKHNCNIENMQLLSDMDLRPVGKASSVILWIRRGWGMLFCAPHNFPLFVDNEFDVFKNAKDRLRDFRKGKRSLMALSSYVCDVYCEPLNFAPDVEHPGEPWANPLFVEYMTVKDRKLHEKANKKHKKLGTGDRVRYLHRKFPQWTQDRLAKEVKVSRQRIGTILNSKSDE